MDFSLKNKYFIENNFVVINFYPNLGKYKKSVIRKAYRVGNIRKTN